MTAVSTNLGSRVNSIAVIVRRLVRVARAFLPAAAVDDEYLRFLTSSVMECLQVRNPSLSQTEALICDRAQILNIFAMILRRVWAWAWAGAQHMRVCRVILDPRVPYGHGAAYIPSMI